ncbi:MAG TPA: tetratricopeptide repeat protein [Terriglobales bacterium]|jgi:tetratricopeptide (TPR) repeat protein|nr:tetratricopeptide repeat protein [Terriglobales bacterium]
MRRLISIFLLSFCAFAQGGSIQEALRAHQFDQALQLIRAALRKTPKDARLLTMEGAVLSQTGKKAEALAAFNQALTVTPNNLAALEGAAQLEYEAKSKRAIPLLNRILAQQPDNLTSHAMLAILSYQEHDCAEAVKHFQASSATIGNQPSALGAYGSCLMRLDRAAEAVPVFQKLATLTPDDPHARYNLAVVQLAAGQGKQSLETLQPLLDAETTDADVLDLASSAYESIGDTPHAVSTLRQAIVASPRKEKYYVDFATLSYNHDSFQVGIDVVDAGLKQLPNAAGLYIARGILYIQLGQYEKGQADFEAARKLDPSQASASVAQGLAQMQASKLDQALKTVDAQLVQHPKDSFLYYLKAEIISRNGAEAGSDAFKAAVTSASRAVQLKPDFTLARNVLGNLYLKSGQVDKAIEQSRETLRYDPSDEVALYHLLQGLRRTKDPKGELPALTKRLAVTREQSKEKEASQGRYKLYEEN